MLFSGDLSFLDAVLLKPGKKNVDLKMGITQCLFVFSFS